MRTIINEHGGAGQTGFTTGIDCDVGAGPGSMPMWQHGLMIAVSRFRVAPDAEQGFVADAEVAVAQFASSHGCLGAELVRNLDDAQLWAIISTWAQVGDYRRAFNGTPAKMALIPLLSRAIDEPSAYSSPDDVGANIPRVG